MSRRPTSVTLTDTPLPYTTPLRSRAVGNHGPIGDIDGERLIEAEARRLAARDRLAELLGAFAREHHRHQARKVQRALGADAAMAERARGGVERAFRRSVVEVDGLLVEHFHLHHAERSEKRRVGKK